MGNPSLGKIMFVSSIQTHSMIGFSNGSNMLQDMSITTDSPLPFCSCRDLYLQLVQPNYRILKQDDSTSEVNHDELENGNSSSPKTPLFYKSKLKSPAASNMTRSQDTVSNMRCSNETISDTYDLEEALGNIKSRELLQTCASLWLRDRFLLHGNLVAIPMGGKTSNFLVQGANGESIECPSEESENERKCVSSHNAESVDVGQLSVLVIGNKTKVDINSPMPSLTQISTRGSLPPVELDSKDIKDNAAGQVLKLGGLSNEYAILKDIINSLSMKGPLSSVGLRSIKGVLLHGPPGTGKTSLARSCVIDAGINFFSINGPEIIGQFHGETEQALCEVFDSASKAPPAAVFIDELDAIAPARKDGGDELSQRMVATLLNLMDGISQTDGILVIAATNRTDSIDPALRRPGRLEREIEIGVPSPEKRLDILHSLLYKMDHALVSTEIQHLASNTHGFVGADLASLCNEAALVCLRHHIKLKNSHNSSSVTHHNVQLMEPCIGCSDDPVVPVLSLPDLTVSSVTAQSCNSSLGNQQLVVTPRKVDHIISDKLALEVGKKAALKISFDDFEEAKRKVRPSAMREVILEIPKVRWEDVGGQNEAKKQLMEAVEWPQKHRGAFERIGTRPPTGVLMFGPPGCSKTLMARAVASEAGLNFLSVKGPELFSKWVGESEKAVKSVFAKARANAPSIIFFDEIDGLAVIRGKENGGASVSDRVMSQLLVELDGLHQRVDVTVIAATNRPDKIDPALLRPGRFDRLLYIGPPNEADREDIFNIHARRMPCSSSVRIKELAHLTEGCTGADISLICREAAFAAIEESLDVSEVSMEHFKVGVRRVQPAEVGCYQEFCTKFQRHVLSGKTVGDSGCKQSSIAHRSGIRNLLKPFLLTTFPIFCILCTIKSFFRLP